MYIAKFQGTSEPRLHRADLKDGLSYSMSSAIGSDRSIIKVGFNAQGKTYVVGDLVTNEQFGLFSLDIKKKTYSTISDGAVDVEAWAVDPKGKVILFGQDALVNVDLYRYDFKTGNAILVDERVSEFQVQGANTYLSD